MSRIDFRFEIGLFFYDFCMQRKILLKVDEASSGKPTGEK